MTTAWTVGFDDTRRARGSASEALAELIKSWKAANDGGLYVDAVEYPSCFSDQQLRELKALVPSHLLHRIVWTPGKP